MRARRRPKSELRRLRAQNRILRRLCEVLWQRLQDERATVAHVTLRV